LTGTGVDLVGPSSLLPSLRANKEEGQANFVNPGLWLGNLGSDFEVTPKLRAFANVNYLRFDKTAPLELLLFQRPIRKSIGTDVGLGFEYRPPLSENITIRGGVAGLQPGRGLRDLYHGPRDIHLKGRIDLVTDAELPVKRLAGLGTRARLGLALEFSVALMLILLGVLNLTGALHWISHKLSPTHPDSPASQTGQHSHLHFHCGKIHVHPHSHDGDPQHHAKEVDPPHWLAEPFVKLGWFHSLRPLLVGVVHGLAGSAAVALLVLGTIHNARWAIFYLLLFGIGTIAGMMLLTLAFAVPVTVAGNRFAWISRTMVAGTGVLSLAFGLVVAYQIGIVDGLFSSHPSWTPH